MVEMAEGKPLMAAWTNKEFRQLAEMYQGRRPSYAELAAAFPRHSLNSIVTIANKRHPARADLLWLKIAHQHFAQREAEMRP